MTMYYGSKCSVLSCGKILDWNNTNFTPGSSGETKPYCLTTPGYVDRPTCNECAQRIRTSGTVAQSSDVKSTIPFPAKQRCSGKISSRCTWCCLGSVTYNDYDGMSKKWVQKTRRCGYVYKKMYPCKSGYIHFPCIHNRMEAHEY
jgi:hypothetical protein